MRQLLVLLLGLAFAPLIFSADGMDLTIPDSPVEMEKTLGDDTPCKGCGVVTNIRQLAPAAVQDSPPQDSTYTVTFAEATRDPGGEVDVTGFRVNEAGESAGGAWQTTVRYDDGSYAAHQSETQPPFQKGDRVQLVSGQLVPR